MLMDPCFHSGDHWTGLCSDKTCIFQCFYLDMSGKVCVNISEDASTFLYFLDCCSEMGTGFTPQHELIKYPNLVLGFKISCSIYLLV